MQLDPIFTTIEASLSTQLAATGADPALEEAAARFLAALEPALRQAGMSMAEQAAAEVSAQLGDQTVEVVVVDGDPVLRVSPHDGESSEIGGEEFDARLTLRLPPSLKSLVEDAAGTSGDSVNSWVVKTLSSGTKRSSRIGRRVSGSFDL
jgi:uncharacterized protein (DUF1778 family)